MICAIHMDKKVAHLHELKVGKLLTRGAYNGH